MKGLVFEKVDFLLKIILWTL